MLCPCKSHPVRDPAPFGSASPCCGKLDAKMWQWKDHYEQYGTCGPIQGPGCRKLYWHNGKFWVLVDKEQRDRLEKIF